MHLLSSRRLGAAAASAVALALVLTGCSGETDVTYTPPSQVDGALPEDTVAQMQAAVDNAISASGASGAIVGVWVPWSGEWVAATGTQAQGDDTKVTTDMSFRIADTTRLMTCDVLYGMADDGLIELDAAVPDYVSGVADLKDITLLDLCNGTAGIGSSEATLKSAWLTTPERVWSPLELAAFGLGQEASTAHTAYRDSDAGYLLLGLALERASGKSAAALIEQYVTEPLGLEQTRLPGARPAAASDDAVLRGNTFPAVEGGYDCTAPTDVSVASASMGYTDSGAVSTIEDLGTYIQATAAQALRAEDAEPARFGTPLPVSASSPSWYQATGGAFIVGSMIGQQGWVPGYATSAYSDPATGFTVAVTLNNSSSGSSIAAYLAWELAAIASKAPAADGQTAPDFGLPFTAQQYHDTIASIVTCAAPPAG